MKVALAIFVKTPGVSPVKTRLAERIGVDGATEFYRYCLGAVEAVVNETAENARGLILPWWAVGESHTLNHPLWKKFPVLYTGPGGLGCRLHTVYSQLMRDHDFVFLMGSDSPQITSHLLIDAITYAIESDEFVLGPARDGGFYLLGGSRLISLKQFRKVTYSHDRTSQEMIDVLEKTGNVHRLSELTDVDRVEDIPVLNTELKSCSLPPQRLLRSWLEDHRCFSGEIHAE